MTELPAICIHGMPLNMTCHLCGRILPGVADAAALAGHSPGPRKYRIHGRITPTDRAGKFYDVDLVVEPLP